jgi:hypothetical protein
MHKTNKIIVKALSVANFDIKNVILSDSCLRGKVKIDYVTPHSTIVLQTPFLKVGTNLKSSHQDPSVWQLETIFSGLSEKKIVAFRDMINNLEEHVQDQMSSHPEWLDSNEDPGFFNLINEDEDAEGLDNEFIKWHIHSGVCVFENKDNPSTDDSMPNITTNHLVRLIIEIPNLMVKNNKGRLLVVVRKVLYQKFVPTQVSEYIFDNSDSEVEESDGEENRIANVMNQTDRPPARFKEIKKSTKRPIAPPKPAVRHDDYAPENGQRKHTYRALDMADLPPTGKERKTARSAIDKVDKNAEIFLDGKSSKKGSFEGIKEQKVSPNYKKAPIVKPSYPDPEDIDDIDDFNMDDGDEMDFEADE